MDDLLILEVADFGMMCLTGSIPKETGKPQPLRISVQARMKPLPAL